LIVTRRDPMAVRPPAAYRLLWQGTYYQVWGRRPRERPALVHVALPALPARVLSTSLAVSRGSGAARASNQAVFLRTRCLWVLEQALPARALRGQADGVRLVAALAPELIAVPIPRSHLHRPPGWQRAARRILMTRPGTLRLTFSLPHGGLWQVWLQGDVMRALRIAVDGRPLGSLGGQLGGNSLVANTLSPLTVSLSAGAHTLTISRPGASLAPGDDGAAVLAGVFLAPAGPAGLPSLVSVPFARRRSLCRRAPQWVELLPKR
jgi:hypothetical protein